MPEWISVNEKLPDHGVGVLACYQTPENTLHIIRAKHLRRWTERCPSYDYMDNETELISEYSEADDEYFHMEDWYELIDNWPEYKFVGVGEGTVTHWMPLPVVPERD